MAFNITPEVFNVKDEKTARKRPKKATGTVSRHAVKWKKPPPPLACLTDTSNEGDVNGFDRGHLIAESLGGPNKSENIVPMYSTFHQAGGVWRKLEERLLSLRSDWKVVAVTVDVEYADNVSQLVPSGFKVTATVSDDENGGAHVYFNGNKLDQYLIAHQGLTALQTDMTTHNLAKIIIKAQKEMSEEKWAIEKHDKNAKEAIAVDDDERPYAVLDYLWLYKEDKLISEFIGPRVKVEKRKDFTKQQKELIYLVNRLRNDGWLKSDYKGDTAAPLVTGVGGRDAVQIDHVLDQLKGGANLFSNARVSSGKFNNLARNKPAKDKFLLTL